MENSVKFGYGALCGTLEEQANSQGYTLGTKGEKLENLRKARLQMLFGNLLTDAQQEQTAKKINKQVVSALKPLN